jgi:hypothetical protein
MGFAGVLMNDNISLVFKLKYLPTVFFYHLKIIITTVRSAEKYWPIRCKKSYKVDYEGIIKIIWSGFISSTG